MLKLIFYESHILYAPSFLLKLFSSLTKLLEGAGPVQPIFLGQMSQLLERDEKTGHGQTDSTQKEEREKARGPALIGARKPCFTLE